MVEIVISLAILTVITSMFLQSVVKQFTLMQETKSITENVFSSANKVERTMQDYKDALNETPAPNPLPAPATYTLFAGESDERVITYYPVMEFIKDKEGNPSTKTIYSVVTDISPPEFEVPVITSTETKIKYDGIIVDGSYATPTTVIQATADISNSEIHLMTKFQWYISDTGFPRRWNYVDMEDSGVGINLPVYPKNFSIIPYATASQLTVEPEMAGRHVVCVMTPASLAGRMGRSVVSKPQYIYGLTVLDNLAAHYDASLIDAPVNIIDLAPNKKGVNTWPDISYILDSSYNDADAERPGGSGYPIINETQVAFDGDSWMEPYGLGSKMNLAAGFTMFAVVNISDMSKSTIISDGDAWSFNPQSYPGLEQGQWYVLGINSDGMYSVGKDGSIFPLGSSIGDMASMGIIKIGSGANGDSKIDLAELIIYNGLLSDADWRDVTQYLGGKYKLD